MDGVMLDIDATDITRTDGHTAPVLVADIREFAIADLLFGAHLAEVGRRVGQVGFDKEFSTEDDSVISLECILKSVRVSLALNYE